MTRPLHDYALLSNCHGAALVACDGAIDWCCLPRFDSDSFFARLLDDEHGGGVTVRAADGAPVETEQRYRDDTLILETTLRGDGWACRLHDALVLGDDGPANARHEIVRIVEGLEGETALEIHVDPRFDYAEVRPWMRRQCDELVTAIGGDDAVSIYAEQGIEQRGDHDLVAPVRAGAGDRVRLSITRRPAETAQEPPGPPTPEELERRLEDTERWWQRYAECLDAPMDAATRRSALVLRGLVYEPTGAIIAAATTSLPETPGGERNWDYRYSWIRDSAFTVRTLARLGSVGEARRFGRFVLRSAAGHADELQILFGVGGERRLPELELDLAGYGGARPVRVGNEAAGQRQLDAYGQLVNIVWSWHERGRDPDEDEWRFVCSLVDAAGKHWNEPDRGIWEWRGQPRHFVYSKAACWSALDRGIRLAEELGVDAPVDRWAAQRDEVGEAIEREGWDDRRGTYLQAFGHDDLDASALLLPLTGLVAWDDERMASTADAIRADLCADGLVRRYRSDDALPGREGTFLACTFWLAEAYARQGRGAEAREVYEAAMATASPLGLFTEEYDPERELPLGNYPQGLTHLAQIGAALSLAELGDAAATAPA